MEHIVVNDTNIFIDLIELGILNQFTSLPWEVHTTKFVVHELKKSDQSKPVQNLADKGIVKIGDLDVENMTKVASLYQQNQNRTNVSFTDCSVWHFAKSLNYILLTGDMKLRKAATKDGVEVHGLIYIIDAMVEHDVLTKQQASEKLKELKIINPRQPISDIDKRIREWGGEKKKGECL